LSTDINISYDSAKLIWRLEDTDFYSWSKKDLGGDADDFKFNVLSSRKFPKEESSFQISIYKHITTYSAIVSHRFARTEVISLSGKWGPDVARERLRRFNFIIDDYDVKDTNLLKRQILAVCDLNSIGRLLRDVKSEDRFDYASRDVITNNLNYIDFIVNYRASTKFESKDNCIDVYRSVGGNRGVFCRVTHSGESFSVNLSSANKQWGNIALPKKHDLLNVKFRVCHAIISHIVKKNRLCLIGTFNNDW